MNRIILIILIICSGCKSATTLVYKAHKKDEIQTAEACYNLFPSKDSIIHSIEYIKGRTDSFKNPPMIINCDSLIEANKGTDEPNVILHTCPASTHSVDTLRDTKTIVKQSKALERMYLDLVKKDVKNEQIITDKNRIIKKQNIWIVALILYTIIRNIIRFKFPLIYKFLP